MNISPDSPSGKRLKRYGVSANALRKSRVFAVAWMPVPAFTLPLPVDGSIILVHKSVLAYDAVGELADGSALAPLVHQLHHAHQRQEWGYARYLLRHLWSRLFPGGVPVHHRQVERECYLAARAVEEAYSQERIASIR
ncbi:MAG: hypothetical protein HY680_09180 [Chloroflexi bacterium]|nr:hypothetical protein [Chloroflexota bacterium]